MDMTNKEYGTYVNSKSRKSPIGKNIIWAFLVGGLICVIGQALLGLYQKAGLDETQAGAAVSITLIIAAALLTGLGIFDKIAKRAGAGTLVPITGFATPWSPRAGIQKRGIDHRYGCQALYRGGTGAGVRYLGFHCLRHPGQAL